MKKLVFLLLSCLPFVLSGQGLKAIYSFATFSSNAGNYVEITTSIDVNSLVEKQGGVEVELTVLICKVEDSTPVVYVEKRNLKAKKDASLTASQMLDTQRARLDNGDYILYMSFADKNSSKQPIEIKDVIRMSYPEGELAVSDIQIINTPKKAVGNTVNTKQGYEIIPYSFDAIPKTQSRIDYYVEVYNADKYFKTDSLYALTTVIEDLNTNRKVEGFMRVERVKSQDISAFIGAIDIASLPEGSYYLTVEVRDSKNILHAYKREAFFRQSDLKSESSKNLDIPSDAFVFALTEEQLDDNIKTLVPIASESQIHFIEHDLDSATKDAKLYFLYNFWKNQDAVAPQRAWQEYRTRLEYVNRVYKTNIKEGYLTDMGRVYLVYGPPSDIIDEKFKASSGLRKRTMNDIAATPGMEKRSADGVNYLPYQMWRYDRTPFGETNRMFVFYAQQNDLTEYTLLHSNAKGERNEIYWEDVLSRYTLGPGVEGAAGVQFRKGHK